ncbi:MAG TPA: dipeptidase PepE [Flavisolibacter sp.]|nr:dipeptidase PepE [Flavisolibacter sp.]
MSNVLALSSSRVGNGDYLENALPFMSKFLGNDPRTAAFIPFASVSRDYVDYGRRVKDALSSLVMDITLVTEKNAPEILNEADCILVGGGNTFKLLHDLCELNLLPIIRKRIAEGCSYVGWSAGSNIAGRTIGTTNDMPIIQPQSFSSLGIFPFQINPHYLNQAQEGFHGETRDQRLEEYVLMNPGVPVVALPEGTALLLQKAQLSFAGITAGVLFQSTDGMVLKKSLQPGSDLSWLM